MFNFWFKKSLGLDISDRSLELVELRQLAGQLTVTAFNRALLPKGVVVDGEVRDASALTDRLRQLLATAYPKAIHGGEVAFALPENQTYLHTFSLPNTGQSKEEIEAAAWREAREHFPLSPEELLVTHVVQSLSGGAHQIMVVGAPRRTVTKWQGVLEGAGLRCHELDFETLGTARGVFSRGVTALTALLDLGAKTTTISLFDRAGLFYSYSLVFGGEELTTEIAKQFELSLSAAEERKTRLGLSESDKNLALLLTKSLRPLIDELTKLEQYLGNEFNQTLAEVVLVGGGSFLLGLRDYLGRNLEVPVRLGELSSEIKVAAKIAPDFAPHRRFYLEAVGLATGLLRPAATPEPRLLIH